MRKEEAYNSCFLAALTGLCANPAILAESDETGHLARKLQGMGRLADAAATHAVKFVQPEE